MRKNKLRAVVFAATLINAGVSFAQDRVMIANRDMLEQQCRTATEVGIHCQFVDAEGMLQPEGDADRWVKVGESDLYPPMQLPASAVGLLNRLGKTPYYGQLLLFMVHDAHQQPYYMGHMAVLTPQPLNPNGFPVLDQSKEEAAWGIAANRIAFDLPDSTAAQAYLATIDATADARAAAVRQKAEAEAAQQAYLASPEYKRQQLQSSAQQCQKTIKSARALIEKDQRIAAVSGYENSLLREQAASLIISCEDIIAEAQRSH